MGFMNLPNEPPVELSYDETDGMQLDGELYPLFTRISIETLSFCNRDCVFCPLHWSQKERGTKRMTDELYWKIVAELGEVSFSGVAQMFLLSEPTIDRSMLDKLRLLRAECPKVTTYASSNGDVFDAIMKKRGIAAAVDKIHEYYDAGLTVLNLNIYDEGPEQAARYQELYARLLEGNVRPTNNKYRKHAPKGRFVALTDMRQETNGEQGLVNILYIKTKSDRQTITAPQIHCARTQRHLVVEFDGNVPVCCAIDVTDKSLPSMGNINERSLLEVWNGEAMMKYRWFTQQKMRTLAGCSTCTHRMAFPAIVRKVRPNGALLKKWMNEEHIPGFA